MIYNQSQNNKNKNIINNRKYTYNFDNMKNQILFTILEIIILIKLNNI